MNAFDGLRQCAGNWRGTNVLQDPTSGKPDESASTLHVTPVLGDRFIRLDYTWRYQDKPQEGSLLVGLDPKTGEVSGHWIDTWHMGRIAMDCRGSLPADGGVVIRGSYAAPPGPDWGWRIDINTNDDTVRIMHTNADPAGKEEPAVEGVYTRMDHHGLIAVAAALARPFVSSEDCTSGEVGAALVTASGALYTGVCVDLACGIGFCAEHAAIAEMLKARESEVRTIVAVNAEGSVLPPCGRCRELLWQIDSRNARTWVVLGEGEGAQLADLLPHR
jgi:cytidine deaminase